MLVFIDESGDPGFKLEKGSSPSFVLTMVIFRDLESASYTQKKIVECQQRNKIKPEWKFNKCSYASKDAFFNCLRRCHFETRTVVVQKELIYSTNLKTKPREFYNFFTKQMMKNDGGVLKDARIVIDGSGDRKFKKELHSYLRRSLPSGTLKKLNFKDSRKDPLVQLADMCAGAIARSYNAERKDSNRWRQQLANSGHIQDVWEFK